MARKLRIEYAGALYHVTARGNDRQVSFGPMQTAHPNLNHCIHALNTAYTGWSNKRKRRTEHLFEGPYRAIAKEILRAICIVRGVKPDALERRGWHHVERDVAMFLSREIGEKTLKEIGQAFGVGVAATGHAQARVRRRRQTERAFANSIETAKADIN